LKIQILTIAGCPNAAAATAAVRIALQLAGAQAIIQEITVGSAEVPGFAGSPTILVNGRDVEPAIRCDGPGCRIYSNPDNAGIPALQSIQVAIESALQAERFA